MFKIGKTFSSPSNNSRGLMLWLIEAFSVCMCIGFPYYTIYCAVLKTFADNFVEILRANRAMTHKLACYSFYSVAAIENKRICSLFPSIFHNFWVHKTHISRYYLCVYCKFFDSISAFHSKIMKLGQHFSIHFRNKYLIVVLENNFF